MTEKIKLGISSCLLGQKVRYNGGHTLDHFLTDILGQYVDYVPVCPEVEIGLPIPREALRLVKYPGDNTPRLVTQKTGVDYTGQMLNWAKSRLDQLEKENLCGYIFKSKSPSSGMERINVYNEKGVAQRNGVGMFARAFLERFALMPVEDEGRLHDIVLRENFIVRVFTYHRWRQVLEGPHTIGAVVDFHSKNKLLFMAHHPEMARQLGKLPANAKELPIREFFASYQTLMMTLMKFKASVRKHANVLYHMMGYFKKQLDPGEKQELVEIIEQYRVGYYPLVVPLTLIKHYVRKYEQPYLKDQYYLDPHPAELKLRNHA
jgi:uncharacterized protein YbgA (DUF1722 family)/uncharacterized protein YbbK (DUF523 family)